MPARTGREPELDPKNHIASVFKAIRMLELFATEGPEMELPAIVRKSGLTRTTAHRLLSTLELAGWIERTTSGAYRLALRVFEVGSVVVGSLDIRHEATHAMSKLAAEHGEDVYLIVPDGPRGVCLERHEGRTRIHAMVLDAGRSLPLFVGGGPLALLAARETELLPLVLAAEPLITPTGQTVTEDELRHRLAETRERGYSVSVEDVTPGIGALGACIYDSRGTAVAALSVGGLITNLGEDRRQAIARSLIEAAREVSRRLGNPVVP